MTNYFPNSPAIMNSVVIIFWSNIHQRHILVPLTVGNLCFDVRVERNYSDTSSQRPLMDETAKRENCLDRNTIFHSTRFTYSLLLLPLWDEDGSHCTIGGDNSALFSSLKAMRTFYQNGTIQRILELQKANNQNTTRYNSIGFHEAWAKKYRFIDELSSPQYSTLLRF